MGSWIHDAFLDSRCVPGFMLVSWIHDGLLNSRWFLDSRWVPGFTMGSWVLDSWIHNGFLDSPWFLDSRWVLHPQEGGRLDAKRHYVISAKALDGIWPVGHACATLC